MEVEEGVGAGTEGGDATVGQRRGSESGKRRRLTGANMTVLQRHTEFGVQRVLTKSTALCWSFFCVYGQPLAPAPHDLQNVAICRLCVKKGVYAEHKCMNSSTTGLNRHLESQHADVWKEAQEKVKSPAKGQPGIGGFLGTQPPPVVTGVQSYEEALMAFVVGFDLPFSVVENKLFRNLIHKLNPRAKPVSRRALKKMMQAKREELQETLDARLKGEWVSICADGWTALRRRDRGGGRRGGAGRGQEGAAAPAVGEAWADLRANRGRLHQGLP